MKSDNMNEKEFREKYENKLKEYGYFFYGIEDETDDQYNILFYVNKEKDLLIIGYDKETKKITAQLLPFKEKKAEYDLTIDELFEFLEKEE